LPGLEINFVSKRISDLSKTAVPISRWRLFFKTLILSKLIDRKFGFF
jgi:hypothetical protein